MYHPCNNQPPCHFRANACGVPSNPEGAPAGGISALVQDIFSNRFRTHQTGAKPHSAKLSHLPKHKNFPHDPAIFPKRNKFSLRKRRGHGGSSGWVREVWRVVTDFATQNLVNSGFAALDSPSERGLPAPPRSSFPCLSYPFAAAISSCFLASRSASAFSMSDL